MSPMNIMLLTPAAALLAMPALAQTTTQPNDPMAQRNSPPPSHMETARTRPEASAGERPNTVERRAGQQQPGQPEVPQPLPPIVPPPLAPPPPLPAPIPPRA